MNPPDSTSPPSSGRLPLSAMLTQTWAMTVDVYRELNAKRLFWITTAMSGLVVGVFAAVGFNERGFSIFGKTFDSVLYNTTMLPTAQLYKNTFVYFGVQWWLGFLALLLAMISTASMFPDFLSGGAVDLYLARPLGRARLFLTKYCLGLLFAAIQVAAFCLLSFLVIGIRGGRWVPAIFLAIPIVVLMFSYIWSICAFFGTVTRSTIASLLLTLVVWFLIWCVHTSEGALLFFDTASHVQAQELDRDIERYDADIAKLNATPATTQPKSFESTRLKMLTASAESSRTARAKITYPLETWHRAAFALKWPLPKTADTAKLMERFLDKQFIAGPERPQMDDNDDATGRGMFRNPRMQNLIGAAVDKEIRSRSAFWVISTSVGFEAILLALTTLIFSRRDY